MLKKFKHSYASGSTAYTIVINSDISASSLTKVSVGSNKTFIGAFGSAELTNIHFRCTSSSGNVIFKNITLTHDAAQNENDDIQMYISDGNNFWIDHCTFTGHTSMQSDDVDKHMYVGLKADFVSVTGCYFGGHKYGLILGYPNEDGSRKVVDDKGVGAFTDTGSVLSSDISNLSTGATSWRPSTNYGYATRSASDAKTWAAKYAGAQNSKITYAID